MDFLIAWIENSGGLWVYVAVLISSFAENVFTPLPGDTVTVFGAYLAGLGKVNPIGIHIAATIGGTAGFMGLYLFGKSLQNRGLRRGRLLGVKIEKISKMEKHFAKFGLLMVLFNRFLYGIRFVISIFAGMSRLNWKTTALLALLGTALWNVVLVYLGTMLGENWTAFKQILWEYNRYLLVALILVIVIISCIKLRPSNKTK